MHTGIRWFVYGALILTFSFISGCGGGAADSDNAGLAVAAKTASWSPPATFSDGTPLNPTADLSNYEIFVKESGSFSEADTPTAIVSAVDPQTNQVTTSFNLANLGPFLQKGVTYYVSMRAVALDGLKSAFSAPASFSL
jgi:hypothetical protein